MSSKGVRRARNVYEGLERAKEERFLGKDHEQVFAPIGVCTAHEGPVKMIF